MKLRARSLVVIGLGAIGSISCKCSYCILGMEVYGYDPYISVEGALKLIKRMLMHVKTREEIYKECDYITVHVPLIR